MKNFIRIALGLAMLCLYACEKAVSLEGYTDSANATLYVRTMAVSTSEEEDISYPIQVYVFSGQKCAALQTIADESQALAYRCWKEVIRFLPLAEHLPAIIVCQPRQMRSFYGDNAARRQKPCRPDGGKEQCDAC